MTPAGALALAALLASTMMGGSLLVAKDRMEREQARQVVCAREVRAELAKRPLLLKGWVRSPDACRDLAAIGGRLP